VLPFSRAFLVGTEFASIAAGYDHGVAVKVDQPACSTPAGRVPALRADEAGAVSPGPMTATRRSGSGRERSAADGESAPDGHRATPSDRIARLSDRGGRRLAH
jgi:hypothetical protein